MNFRRFLIEGATLVIAAVILGLVANAIAGAEKKVALAAFDAQERPATTTSRPEPVPDSSIIEYGAPATTTDLPTSTDPSLTDEPGAGQTPGVPPATSPPVNQPAAKATLQQILQRFPSTPDIPAEEIHTADAKWLWDQGVLFLDARRTAAYNDGRIARARNFAVWESSVDEKVKKLSTEGLNPDMPIVIYCSGGECEDSHMLAQKLWGVFFNNLRVYHEGYPGWQEAGYPIERGSGS